MLSKLLTKICDVDLTLKTCPNCNNNTSLSNNTFKGSCSFVLQFRNSDSDIIEIQIKFRTRLVHNRSGQTMRRWKDIFIRMKFAFFKPFRKSLIYSLKLSLTLGTGRLLLPFDTKLYCSKKEGLEQISSFLKNLSNEISFVNIGCILAEF